MPLTYACIAPHGDIIPELGPRSVEKRFLKTRNGMIKIAREIRAKKPDTVIIATPHNLRLWKNIAIITSENSSGQLTASRDADRTVKVRAKCDREFALELLDRARKRRLPVVGANYGAAEGKTSDMPMDWGTLVPLWFIVRHAKRRPKIVVVTPSREIRLFQNFSFGRLVAELAEQKSERFVFVASADQAHAHRKSGPFGFSKAAAAYDQLIVEAIRMNRLNSIMNLNARLVEKAKPDSLWQMTMLAGVLSRVPMRGELFSYQVPTYYGMACAGFQRMD